MSAFFDPLYLKIFLRSFKIAGITTVICFLFGLPHGLLARHPAKEVAKHPAAADHDPLLD